MKERKHDQVRSRNEAFTERTSTRIWGEQASEDNPYIAQSTLCHGYDLYELINKSSFIEVFYLLFRGELPSADETELLEKLMIALINPGPRHPATRAAMNAGVGKSLPVHILPIATSVMGGDYLGGGEIEPAMRFLRKGKKNNPDEYAQTLLDENQHTHPQTDNEESIAPGFGSRFGGIDLITHTITEQLLTLKGAGPTLQWAHQLSLQLNKAGFGLLPTGLAAAIFSDLGFQPRAGGTLFQLISAPGLAAHGLELANRPFTAMPYVRDENYFIEDK
ncbi:MAG: citrate/2-methylcitrate synthase [Cellvibrionaceae bacterium]